MTVGANDIDPQALQDRVDRGMKQYAIAVELGCSRATVQRAARLHGIRLGQMTDRTARIGRATIDALIARGVSQPDAAAALGVHPQTLSKIVRGHGRRWPRFQNRRGRPAVWHAGRWVTLPDLARITGMEVGCIRERFRNGVRGAGLTAPADPLQQRPDPARQGIDRETWADIGSMAREQGAYATAELLELPVEPIFAAMRGRLEALA